MNGAPRRENDGVDENFFIAHQMKIRREKLHTFKDDAKRALADFLSDTKVVSNDTIRGCWLRRMSRGGSNDMGGCHLR